MYVSLASIQYAHFATVLSLERIVINPLIVILGCGNQERDSSLTVMRTDGTRGATVPN